MNNQTVIAGTASTWTARIYMAGDYDVARVALRKHCERGACVSINRADYIYTGGEEAGFVVTIINYPRFPRLADELRQDALDLADELIRACSQTSASVETPAETIWLSRRDEGAPS